jgi:hypothetical protein
MEKRFQVFVSSTFRDLQEERQQVIQALLELDCIPAGMGLFPASDETKWSLITRVIDDCDYYIVIVGGRYGSVDEQGISYTEREYDYAVKCGIPVLAFLHAEPDAIPAGKTEMQPETRQKLDTFRQKAEQRMCRYWRTPEDLGGVVSRSLVQMMRLQPGEGWARARFAANSEELQRFRSKIDELTAKLEAARTEPPAEAKNLAQGSAKFRIGFVIDRAQNDVDLTWNQIFTCLVFTCLGPPMFDEASESDLKKQLRGKVASEIGWTDPIWRTEVQDEDFQTIKVQLRALRLIQKSVKKRSLKDTDTYWTLTPYGEHYATVLKAIPAVRPTLRVSA